MSPANSGRDGELFQGPYPPPFGVQRSTDGGVTWALTLAGETTTIEIDPTNFNNQFAAISLPIGYGSYNQPVPTGVYHSTDDGQTWSLIPGPWSGMTVGRIVLALAPSSPSTLYASVEGGDRHLLGLYRTDNVGAGRISVRRQSLTQQTTDVNSGRVASITVDPGDVTHWLVGTGNGGVWETHDSGTS
jgi:hypothetical protein